MILSSQVSLLGIFPPIINTYPNIVTPTLMTIHFRLSLLNVNSLGVLVNPELTFLRVLILDEAPTRGSVFFVSVVLITFLFDGDSFAIIVNLWDKISQFADYIRVLINV